MPDAPEATVANARTGKWRRWVTPKRPAKQQKPQRDPAVVLLDELHHDRQDAAAELTIVEQSLDRWHRLVELGREDDAQDEVHRTYGIRCSLKEALAKEQADAARLTGDIKDLDRQIASLLREKMYPDDLALLRCEEDERRELADGKVPVFGLADALLDKLWDEFVDNFADQGFGENGELLAAMHARLGIGGMCRLIVAIRKGEAGRIQRYCDLISEEERRGSPSCYNRLQVRRGAAGRLLIVIDQPGNPDYRPPLVHAPAPWITFDRRQVGCSRDRTSHAGAAKRRPTSRSAGGGSGDDDPGGGDSDPPGRPQLAARRHARSGQFLLLGGRS